MTSLENVRNFIIIVSTLRLIAVYFKDGQEQPKYNFKLTLVASITCFVIYYFLGLFS
jgi:hypothetical protein